MADRLIYTPDVLSSVDPHVSLCYIPETVVHPWMSKCCWSDEQGTAVVW